MNIVELLLVGAICQMQDNLLKKISFGSETSKEEANLIDLGDLFLAYLEFGTNDWNQITTLLLNQNNFDNKFLLN